MSDLTKEQVEVLLQLQGYKIPDTDLAEVTHRLNGLMERLREFDNLNVYSVEPWPTQPERRENNG